MLPGISFLFIKHGIFNSVNIIYKSIANLSFGYVQILSLQWSIQGTVLIRFVIFIRMEDIQSYRDEIH